MNEQQHTAATPSDVPPRRKLLRGALAVPAVLTVYSGGSLAAASFERCLANAQLDPQTKLPSTGVDAWLRVRLYQQSPGSSPHRWIHGNDLESPLISKGISHTAAVPKVGQWQEFSISTNKLVGTASTSGPNNPAYSNDYVAVRLDNKGLVVGVGADTAGSAIGQSCWSSFSAGAV